MTKEIAVMTAQPFQETIEEFEYDDVEQVLHENLPTGIFVRFKVHIQVLNDGFVMTRLSDIDYDCSNNLPI